MTAAIEVHGLVKRYGRITAVGGIDLEVAEGELFGLLGPNGAGKTTLVRVLTGLQAPTAGVALVAGIDVARQPDRARRAIGVVPQALTSDLDLTAWENLDIYARYFEVPRAKRLARIEHLLGRVQLWERRGDLVKTFSGGMRRRLEIARGLVHKPRVLFLDEPTIGLDPQSRHTIWELLRDLRKGDALTISLTTHYLDEADALCDRIAIVDHGKLVALGTPAELKGQVPGSDTIELGVASLPGPETLAAVRDLPGVREATVDADGQTLHVRADGGAHLLPRLIELLRSAQVAVTAANMSQISLEDVFMQFTGRSLRDERGDPRGALQATIRRPA